MSRSARVIALAAFVSGALSGTAALAAELGPSLSGNCEGRADVDGYGTIDPGSSEGVYTVPREGSAAYEGSVDQPEGDREVSGSVWLETPPGVPPITLGEWGPDGEEVEAAGTYSWGQELTSWVPAGAEIAVSGRHIDTSTTCEGTVRVVFDGGWADSPAGPATLGIGLLGLAGLTVAGIPKRVP